MGDNSPISRPPSTFRVHTLVCTPNPCIARCLLSAEALNHQATRYPVADAPLNPCPALAPVQLCGPTSLRCQLPRPTPVNTPASSDGPHLTSPLTPALCSGLCWLTARSQGEAEKAAGRRRPGAGFVGGLGLARWRSIWRPFQDMEEFSVTPSSLGVRHGQPQDQSGRRAGSSRARLGPGEPGSDSLTAAVAATAGER